jgi:probable rRNA maturation factor
MVINRQQRVRVAVNPLEAFARRARRALGLGARDLTVCLVNDATIARMNHTFRGKRGPTDVLSFPVNGVEPRSSFVSSASYLGDIAISPETALRNARRLGRALADELRMLILHGMLHLAGYDHETDHGEMDELERRLRRRLGLS